MQGYNMDRTMSEPLEQRVKILELKIRFLESWKSSSFVQVTLPVIVSLALASTWANTSLLMLREDISSLNKRMDSFETRLDSFETRLGSIETRLGNLETKIDQRLGKIEEKLGIQ